MKFKISRSLLTANLSIISVLVTATLVTRLVLIMNAPFIYYFDSYTYMKKAMEIFSSGSIQISVGMPFIVILGSLFALFGPILGAVLISRIFMLSISAALVTVVYLFGFKMSGKVFGFIAGLLAVFEPYFLSFSIVPHNDVFAVAMGMAALYFATSSKKALFYVLAPILFFAAILTRPELYLSLIIPILAFSFYKSLKPRSKRVLMPSIFSIIVYILPAVWVYSVARTLTRFGITEKFALFLTPDLLKTTLGSIFAFYDKQFLDQILFVLVAVGAVLVLLNLVGGFVRFKREGKLFSVQLRKNRNVKEILLSDGVVIAFCLLALFVIHIIVLTGYAYSYVIVDGKLTVIPVLPERYLILPRLLLSYPLAYALSIVVRKVHAEISD